MQGPEGTLYGIQRWDTESLHSRPDSFSTDAGTFYQGNGTSINGFLHLRNNQVLNIYYVYVYI